MDYLIAAMWYGVLQILHIISSFMKLFFIYQYSFISKYIHGTRLFSWACNQNIEYAHLFF